MHWPSRTLDQVGPGAVSRWNRRQLDLDKNVKKAGEARRSVGNELDLAIGVVSGTEARGLANAIVADDCPDSMRTGCRRRRRTSHRGSAGLEQ